MSANLTSGPAGGSAARRAVRRAVSTLLRREHLLAPGQLVIVAVSGGQDSICMLDVLAWYARTRDLRLHVAHVDHRLRGRESAQDAGFVAQHAGARGLPFTLLTADVAGYKRAHHLSTQVAARYARYQLLGRLAAEHRAYAVAIGHTRDDLVETLLLNLIRGSGLRGLAAMGVRHTLRLNLLRPAIERKYPFTEGATLCVIRPLIGVERRLTAAYCLEAGLPFRADPTNRVLDYRRNRVRAEVVPVLERLNPAIRKSVAITAAVLRQDLTIVEEAVEETWRRLALQSLDHVSFERSRFQAEPLAIRRHLLRRAVAELLGGADGLNHAAVESALTHVERALPGDYVPLMRGVVLCVEDVRIIVRRSANTEEPRATPPPRVPLVHLPVPGRAALGALGSLDARIVSEAARVAEMLGRLTSLPANTAALDAERLGPRILVRPRRPGDRMQPLGMLGSKKLQDVLVDAGVPRQWRDSVPVIEASGAIAWLAGVRIDRRFRVDEQTRRIALLRFNPSGETGW